MPYLRTDDRVRLYYEEHGDGPALVLCYGIGGNTDQWSKNVEALAARHRVILWEPRGHARSDAPADPARYTFHRWVLDLRDLLAGLGLGKVTVGGHSLGGGIATRFALEFPRRVRALVVTDSSSAAGVPMSVAEFMMWARSLEVVDRDGIEAVAEYQLEHNANLRALMRMTPSARADILARFRRLQPAGFANSLRAMMGMDSHADRLRAMRIPTLILAGDKDPSLGPARLMHRAVRGSRLVVFEPATHFANREQPGAWNAAVLAFLAEVHGRARAPVRARAPRSAGRARRSARPRS